MHRRNYSWQFIQILTVLCATLSALVKKGVVISRVGTDDGISIDKPSAPGTHGTLTIGDGTSTTHAINKGQLDAKFGTGDSQVRSNTQMDARYVLTSTSNSWVKSKITNVTKLFITSQDTSAVLNEAGEVWCVGYNVYGALGTGDYTNKTDWVKFPTTGVRDFSAGRLHAVGITSTALTKNVHAGTSARSGATIKMVLPGNSDISGSASQWNAVMIHRTSSNTPVFRINAEGRVDSTGSYYVNGKEVFHPGNLPAGASNVRLLTDNTFDLKDGASPIVFARSADTKDKDNLTFVVEDAVTRITHNNDDASSSLVFTLNNTDTKATGANKNKHES